ncbi:hypothetical protein [Costertonia aggregata]|uniref:Uncharacterized protein n=1 Tax=Costertonia aggregata TaxID=343403 RepID=A0A7H9ASL8_9FLAO|nr:hypothetical protein [Costertonia aggregata]QLG46439.1 hypothetical protein HYG79_14140 [Costertonia aggregata]
MSNMYTGKSSRSTNKPMFVGIIIGAVFIIVGVFIYKDLAAWENSNEQMSLHSLLWAVYDMGGKAAVLGLFIIFGLISGGAGIKKTMDLKKIVKESGKNDL